MFKTARGLTVGSTTVLHVTAAPASQSVSASVSLLQVTDKVARKWFKRSFAIIYHNTQTYLGDLMNRFLSNVCTDQYMALQPG